MRKRDTTTDKQGKVWPRPIITAKGIAVRGGYGKPIRLRGPRKVPA